MKELKSYYRQIKGWLPCGGRLKKNMMSCITATVEDYIASHPDADFAALQAHFGSPQQIATAFVDEMDTQELLHALRIRRRILFSVVYGVGAAVAIWAIVMLILLLVGLVSELGYVVVTGPFITS